MLSHHKKQTGVSVIAASDQRTLVVIAAMDKLRMLSFDLYGSKCWLQVKGLPLTTERKVTSFYLFFFENEVIFQFRWNRKKTIRWRQTHQQVEKREQQRD